MFLIAIFFLGGNKMKKKVFFALSLLLIIICVGGCFNKSSKSNATESKEQYANLALVFDFYDSDVDLNVKAVIWGNYYYTVTDQDLLNNKCQDLDVLMVSNNECTNAVLKNATIKYIKDHNIKTLKELQGDAYASLMSDYYKSSLQEYGVEFKSYSVSTVEYDQESAEKVKEKQYQSAIDQLK